MNKVSLVTTNSLQNENVTSIPLINHPNIMRETIQPNKRFALKFNNISLGSPGNFTKNYQLDQDNNTTICLPYYAQSIKSDIMTTHTSIIEELSNLKKKKFLKQSLKDITNKFPFRFVKNKMNSCLIDHFTNSPTPVVVENREQIFNTNYINVTTSKYYEDFSTILNPSTSTNSTSTIKENTTGFLERLKEMGINVINNIYGTTECFVTEKEVLIENNFTTVNIFSSTFNTSSSILDVLNYSTNFTMNETKFHLVNRTLVYNIIQNKSDTNRFHNNKSSMPVFINLTILNSNETNEKGLANKVSSWFYTIFNPIKNKFWLFWSGDINKNETLSNLIRNPSSSNWSSAFMGNVNGTNILFPDGNLNETSPIIINNLTHLVNMTKKFFRASFGDF
uniref:Uncharacterized protein n=1 Tax=Clastoptera arizonana TaxID=38151 RepID=A0A1B6C0R0_9HEMI